MKSPLRMLGFAVSPSEIVIDADQDGLPDAPPPESNYRPADIEAIACWNCAHFERTGTNDANWPAGICHLWEAQVQGQNVCDRYTADPTMTDTVPRSTAPQDEYMGDAMLAEIYQPDTGIEMAEKSGKRLFRKKILRTGEWDKTPGLRGIERKKLKVVRDGESNLEAGVVSLADLKHGFDEKAYANVTVPLTDDSKEHKNLLRLNQGFVREVEIEDEEDGSALVATMEITEPETAEKIERGTIPDVSSGIYGPVETPEGKKFRVALNHACLTYRPFERDLGPFAVLASETDDPVEHVEGFVPVTPEGEREEETREWNELLSFSHREKLVNEALVNQLELSDDYFVVDIAGDTALVRNKIANIDFRVPFEVKEDKGVELSIVSDWEMVDGGGEGGSDEPPEPAVAPEGIALSDDPVQQARQLRGLRFASEDHREGGGTMPVSTDPLAGVELSDEGSVRGVVQRLLEDNQRLRSQTREKDIDQEIDRVKELGFAEEPGFLRVYRDIMLSDDGEPAAILLSHDENGNETGREKPTLTEVAKKLINALRTNDEGAVLLAQQHISSGDDTPPPAGDGDERSVEERTADAEEALYGKRPQKSGGE
jgi:hypothetical protein